MTSEIKNLETQHNKIKRIPGHSTHKLDTFELLYTAAEYEKFDLSDLVQQAKLLNLTDKEMIELAKRFDSFENDWKTKENWGTSWTKSGPNWK